MVDKFQCVLAGMDLHTIPINQFNGSLAINAKNRLVTGMDNNAYRSSFGEQDCPVNGKVWSDGDQQNCTQLRW